MFGLRSAVALACCTLLGLATPALAQWLPEGTPVPGLHGYHFIMISDGAGGAFFVSPSGAGGGDWDLLAQHMTSGGARVAAWPAAGAVVSATLGNQIEPLAVLDGAGGLLVAWIDYRDTSTYVPALYVQHLTANGTRAPGWPVNGRLVTQEVNDLMGHALVPDGAGGAIVLWLTATNNNNQVFAAHMRSTGSLDPAWPPDGAPLCTLPGYRYRLNAISDGAGGAIATWDDGRNPPSAGEDIYAQHVRAGGSLSPGWPQYGLAVCNAPAAQTNNNIVAVDAQSLIVAWSDGRAGNADVFAQRLNFDGTLPAGWPTNGLRLTTPPTSEYTPLVATDGGDGAYVVWEDIRSGQFDVYATRVLGSGSLDPVWPADGYGVCTSPTFHYPTCAPDGRGGLYLCWTDHISNGYYSDLYATRIGPDAQPAPGWPVNGTQVSLTPQEGELPRTIADGYGAAIVAWWDRYGGIRALKLGPGGVLDASAVAVPDSRLALSAPRPNPSRGSLNFRIELLAGPAARLELYDLAGRRVASQSLGDLSAGSHSVAFNVPLGLRAGIYQARLVQGARTVAVRAGVIR